MKKTITANYAKLVEIRKESTRPAETIAAAIAALGYDETAEAIAACINCRKYDGRISPRNRAWALTITTEGTSDREYIVDMPWPRRQQTTMTDAYRNDRPWRNTCVTLISIPSRTDAILSVPTACAMPIPTVRPISS